MTLPKKLLLGQSAIFLGSHAFIFISLWLVVETSKSPAAASGIFLAITLSNIFPAPLVGFVSDLKDKKSVLSLTRLCGIVLVAIYALFLWSGVNTLWIIYLLVGAVAVTEFLYSNTLSTVIPQVVEQEKLSRANALLESANAIAGIIAPAFVGFVLPQLGYIGSLAIVLILMLAGWAIIDFHEIATVKAIESSRRSSIGRHFLASIRLAWSDKTVLYLISIPFLCNIAMAPLGALVPVMIKLDLDLTVREAGVAMAAFAAGVLAATQLISRVRVTQIWSLGFSVLVLGVGTLATGLLAYPYLLIGSLLAGAGTITLGVTSRTFLQLQTEPSHLGQILALQRALRMSSRPVGLLFGAMLSELTTARFSIVFFGLLLVLIGVLSFTRTPKARGQVR